MMFTFSDQSFPGVSAYLMETYFLEILYYFKRHFISVVVDFMLQDIMWLSFSDVIYKHEMYVKEH